MSRVEGVQESDGRSVSPVKPENEAEEPLEEAREAVLTLGSGAVRDSGKMVLMSESSSAASLGKEPAEEEVVPNGLLTSTMIEEEKKLQAENLKEEESELKDQEKIWQSMTEDIRKERYQRLQFLLSKSNMYTTYLIERMKRQEEEENRKMERRAKRAERLQKKAEEAAAAAAEATKDEDKVSGDDHNPAPRSLRKRKEMTSPEAEKPTATKPAKRRRKMRESSAKEADSASDNSEEERSVEEASQPVSQTSQPGGSASQSQNGIGTGPGALPDGETKSMDEDDDNEDLNVNEKRVINGEEVSSSQPNLFVGGVLRPYQIEGFAWLKLLYENGVNGILADEMGLGKTVQCIAVLAYLAEMAIDGPFLVVAPLSTLPNWHSEFERFAPQVPVVLYHGDRLERKELRRKIHRRHSVIPGVRIHPCVITSYEMAMNDRKYLQHLAWKYLIVDEGHRIKNTHCRLIRELRMYSSTHRLLLTGTPLQNNLAELWSLLNFLLPEIFDDLGSFESWFDIQHLSEGSSNEEIVASEQKDHILSMLHQILTPFMLRRLKSDVELVIPPKKEVMVYATMTPMQQEFYKATVDKTILKKLDDKEEKVEVDARGRPKRRSKGAAVNYNAMMESKNSAKDSDNEDVEAWVKVIAEEQQKRRALRGHEEKPRKSQVTVRLQNVMMQLRKCCNHPYLLEHPLDPATGELTLNEDLVRASGKLLLLDKMLEQLKKGEHRVLIFSQMTRMLDLIQDFCVLRKYDYCRLDGSCSVGDRRESMEVFNRDKDVFVFLLSTRAGGLGINLTGADTVIIYDSDWNPQCDLQAQDRCHRIGQTKPVVVYRFVTAGTIDQKIVERAAAKRKLEKMIIHKGKFKSGIENFRTDLKPVSPEELLTLLETSDVDAVVRSSDGFVSQKELSQLLDRADLYHAWDIQLGKQSSQTLQVAARKVVTQGKCFKVLSIEDGMEGSASETKKPENAKS